MMWVTTHVGDFMIKTIFRRWKLNDNVGDFFGVLICGEIVARLQFVTKIIDVAHIIQAKDASQGQHGPIIASKDKHKDSTYVQHGLNISQEKP